MWRHYILHNKCHFNNIHPKNKAITLLLLSMYFPMCRYKRIKDNCILNVKIQICKKIYKVFHKSLKRALMFTFNFGHSVCEGTLLCAPPSKWDRDAKSGGMSRGIGGRLVLCFVLSLKLLVRSPVNPHRRICLKLLVFNFHLFLGLKEVILWNDHLQCPGPRNQI